MDEKQPLRILIVGAGVAGLTLAYGLRQDPTIAHVEIRIIEKRTLEECCAPAYPVHLSPDGRTALASLLSPAHQRRLRAAACSLPARHDGILIQHSRTRKTLSRTRKTLWQMVQDVGARTAIERQALCEILREGAGAVEYGREVAWVCRAGNGWAVGLDDGETLSADLLIGADGMHSAVRHALHPKREGEFTKLPWTIVNMRTQSAAVRQWSKDSGGMELVVGKGWSAAILPLRAKAQSVESDEDPDDNGMYVAFTLSSGLLATSSSFPDALRTHHHHHQNQSNMRCQCLPCALLSDAGLGAARAFQLWTSRHTIVGYGRAVLLGDAAHGMVPFCGAGASAAIKDAWELVLALRRGFTSHGKMERLDHEIEHFERAMKRRNDPLVSHSRRILWLVQGETAWKRVLRRGVFGGLELYERVSGRRSREVRELERLLAGGGDGTTGKDDDDD